MRILIAPNAFKNSLSASSAASAIEAGLLSSGLECVCEKFPVADGGDGTVSLLVEHFRGTREWTMVQDPLGRLVKASIGWIESNETAVIEMADASGLRLIPRQEYDPLHSSSFGTGQLIRLAIEKGAKKILLGIGGTATVDGGMGALVALGLNIYGAQHEEEGYTPSNYKNWRSIDASHLQRHSHLVILCDVKNYLLGEHGAAKIFAPQKGANADDIILLERALSRVRELVLDSTGRDMGNIERGGAAGGIAAAFSALINAELVNGIDYYLDKTNFDTSLARADLVITGEGKIDDQTMEGKAPFGVAIRAKQKNISVIGMGGQLGSPLSENLKDYFTRLITVNGPGESLAESMLHTEENLRQASEQLGRWLKDVHH